MIRTALLLIILIVTSCGNQSEQSNNSEQDNTTQEAVNEPVIYGDTSQKETTKEVVQEVEEAPKTVVDRENIVPNKEKVEPVKIVKRSKIKFDTTIYPFGRVTEGDTVNHVFTFKNEGNGDLILKNVIVDCGCTTPDYSKEAISPGSSGEIQIAFDTHGKLGSQSRLITIVTNGDPISQILKLEGIVSTD